MKNLEIYADVMENGALSKKKLSEFLSHYSEQAESVAREVAKDESLVGDDLADEFFNNLDEESLLKFEANGQLIELSLGRYHEEPDGEGGKHSFGACYLIEIRNSSEGLQDADDFLLGQEDKLIEKMVELGFTSKK